MAENVLEVRNLTRVFDETKALDDVSLDVPSGIVFGLVGENGAGKTTLIKHLMGLYRAKSGTVRVFGLDPVKDPVGVLGRIGYLSEDRDMPQWMQIQELTNYTAAFYPKWDYDYASELLETFGLDPKQKVSTLSRGQRAQAGLLIAIAHRPDLLILDEPSAGLDAVVRRDILGAIIRTVADQGRTVFFSSHLLDEVERVSDAVAMIHKGKIVLNESLEVLRRRHSRLTFRFPEVLAAAPSLDGALCVEGYGKEWIAVTDAGNDVLKKSASAMGAELVEESSPTLEDIFVARVKGSRRSRAENEE